MTETNMNVDRFVGGDTFKIIPIIEVPKTSLETTSEVYDY